MWRRQRRRRRRRCEVRITRVVGTRVRVRVPVCVCVRARARAEVVCGLPNTTHTHKRAHSGVPIGFRVPVHAVPQNPEELRRLEDEHTTLSVYIWLAQHFEAAFVEVEEARAQQGVCSNLIELGLKQLTTPSKPSRSRRKPAKRSRRKKKAPLYVP